MFKKSEETEKHVECVEESLNNKRDIYLNRSKQGPGANRGSARAVRRANCSRTSPGLVILFLNEREGKHYRVTGSHLKEANGCWTALRRSKEKQNLTILEAPGTPRKDVAKRSLTSSSSPPAAPPIPSDLSEVFKRQSFCCGAQAGALWPWPPSPPSRPCSSPTQKRGLAPRTGRPLTGVTGTRCWGGKLEARSLNTEGVFNSSPSSINIAINSFQNIAVCIFMG